MTIQTSTLGTWNGTAAPNRGQAGTTSIFAGRFRTPAFPIRITEIRFATAGVNTWTSAMHLDVFPDRGEGQPRGPRLGARSTVTSGASDSTISFAFSSGPWALPNQDYWMVLTPASGSVSVNWKCILANGTFGGGRGPASESLSPLPSNNVPKFEVDYEYDDAWTAPSLTFPWFVDIYGSVTPTIPVLDGGTQMDGTTLIRQIALPSLQAGDIVKVAGVLRVSNDLGVNVPFVSRIRIEPTSGSNWGENFDTFGERDAYFVDGHVSGLMSANLTPARHHDYRTPEADFVVPEGAGSVWYAKMVARAHYNGIGSGATLGIDFAYLKAEVVRP